MKCSCCDRPLSDFESTLKHRETGEYLDTCVKCLEGLGIPTKGRPDLSRKVVMEEEPEVLDDVVLDILKDHRELLEDGEYE